MNVQIHDELLMSIHRTELAICPDIIKIMERIYPPKNGLTLTAGPKHSWTNWDETVEGFPLAS